MFYYLYEIKNLINNKIYVGVHKTNDLNDGYMGSGKVIKRAMEKHGTENFTKVILEQFDNSVAINMALCGLQMNKKIVRLKRSNLFRQDGGKVELLGDKSTSGDIGL